ncbi:amino acid adenylation domain-containing protein [Streptomyces sp. NPDC046853]|uniref:amino acid adenylation domain-containing protein n=1 Tax=Streptomyces sp. NPDC046853 TaxID=3154920 RepID=UPI0033E0E1D5
MTDRSLSLYDWFARSARRDPNAVALEVADRTVTYRALERLAAAVAGELVRAHGGPPRRVALLASRSVTAFAGYLAVLRLGAAVVPLNPANPPSRNRTVAGLAGADALVADDNGAAQLTTPHTFPAVTTLLLSDARTAAPNEHDVPPRRASPDCLAYILFTSGSTGRPKGVPIRHRNVSAYVERSISRYEVGPGCRVSHTFDFTFDPSVLDLFMTWGSGATLVVPQRSALLAPVDYIVGRNITHWLSVPSVVSVAADLRNLPSGRARKLRHTVFLGEQLTFRQAELWRAAAPNTAIENAYGPTELTITCTAYRLPDAPAHWPATSNGTVPIGRVHDNLDHVVLDEEGRPAAEGELCVRGPQRFDGYLDPEDDKGRFLTHDPGKSPATIVYEHRDGRGVPSTDYYRTGDRVRSEHGHLIHLGRLDHQIKVHGYRIEPGEIEFQLRRHPAVTDAVVLAGAGPNGSELVACYTGLEQFPAHLARWLRERVPGHMVPRRLNHLAHFPYSPNGKIDRNALQRELATLAGDRRQGVKEHS